MKIKNKVHTDNYYKLYTGKFFLIEKNSFHTIYSDHACPLFQALTAPLYLPTRRPTPFFLFIKYSTKKRFKKENSYMPQIKTQNWKSKYVRSARQKNYLSYMRLKVYKNTIELSLCWPSTLRCGACPAVWSICLKYKISDLRSIIWKPQLHTSITLSDGHSLLPREGLLLFLPCTVRQPFIPMGLGRHPNFLHTLFFIIATFL